MVRRFPGASPNAQGPPPRSGRWVGLYWHDHANFPRAGDRQAHQGLQHVAHDLESHSQRDRMDTAASTGRVAVVEDAERHLARPLGSDGCGREQIHVRPPQGRLAAHAACAANRSDGAPAHREVQALSQHKAQPGRTDCGDVESDATARWRAHETLAAHVARQLRGERYQGEYQPPHRRPPAVATVTEKLRNPAFLMRNAAAD